MRPGIATALFFVALLTACGAAESRQDGRDTPQALTLDAAQQALAPAGPTLGSQRADDVLIWLSSRPAPPVPGTAEMDAYLIDAEGQPISDATVTFDVDMRNMSHGLTLVTAEPAGVGHYAGPIHFLMPGPWRVITIVERPGRETMKLRFEFTVHSK